MNQKAFTDLSCTGSSGQDSSLETSLCAYDDQPVKPLKTLDCFRLLCPLWLNPLTRNSLSLQHTHLVGFSRYFKNHLLCKITSTQGSIYFTCLCETSAREVPTVSSEYFPVCLSHWDYSVLHFVFLRPYCLNRHILEADTGWMNEWMNKRLNEWTNEWPKEWMGK